MKSLARHSTVWLFLALVSPLQLQSQALPDNKPTSGIVTGKVTVKGKGVAGIPVFLRKSSRGWPRATSYRGTTNQDGTYRIENVPPGSYEVAPDAPAFVTTSESRLRILIVSEGETVGDVDFDLVLGAVITGKITDSDGKPLIEEQVTLSTAESVNENRPYSRESRGINTDDRGIYRFFGLKPGRYRVAVGVGAGDSNSFISSSRASRSKQTFYPSVTELSKATILEASEGSEATNIDIVIDRVAESSEKFSVSGSVVEGNNDRPLPNLRLGISRGGEEQAQFLNLSIGSDDKGRFKLNNLAPGKYSLMILPTPDVELRSSLTTFEIVDKDVTGVTIKAFQTATVKGTVALDKPDANVTLAQFGQMEIMLTVRTEDPGRTGSGTTVNRDGTFNVSGLRAGVASFSLRSSSGQAKGVRITRIEQNGVVQPNGIEIRDGEIATGVRLFITSTNGTVRGIVRVENGELPPNASFSVWLTSEGGDEALQQSPMMSPYPQVDSRGRFLIEGLSAGSYLVNVSMIAPGNQTRPLFTKQQVTVADGTTTDVTVIMDLKPTPNRP